MRKTNYITPRIQTKFLEGPIIYSSVIPLWGNSVSIYTADDTPEILQDVLSRYCNIKHKDCKVSIVTGLN